MPSVDETLPEPLLADAFRSAMRQLAGAVCAISVGEGPERGALVATSVTSLSLDPPTLLVCVNRGASAWARFCRSGAFSVNVLAHHHEGLARTFSGQSGARGMARYDGGAWSVGPRGAMVLDDALVAIDCDVEEILERHSHGIVLGRVRAITPVRQGGALVYLRGSYAALDPVRRDGAPR